LFSCHQKGRED
jgi:hypothetical protein